MNLDQSCREAVSRINQHINRSAAQHLVWMRRIFGGHMTIDEYKKEISKLLLKPPNLDDQSYQGVVEFKEIAEHASRMMRSERATAAKLDNALNQLRAWYP